MASGPVGSCWRTGSWSSTCWAANTWAGSAPVPHPFSVGGGTYAPPRSIPRRERYARKVGRGTLVAADSLRFGLASVSASAEGVGTLGLSFAARMGRPFTFGPAVIAASGGATGALALGAGLSFERASIKAKGIRNPTPEQIDAELAHLLRAFEEEARRAYEEKSPAHILARMEREAVAARQSYSPWSDDDDE